MPVLGSPLQSEFSLCALEQAPPSPPAAPELAVGPPAPAALLAPAVSPKSVKLPASLEPAVSAELLKLGEPPPPEACRFVPQLTSLCASLRHEDGGASATSSTAWPSTRSSVDCMPSRWSPDANASAGYREISEEHENEAQLLQAQIRAIERSRWDRELRTLEEQLAARRAELEAAEAATSRQCGSALSRAPPPSFASEYVHEERGRTTLELLAARQAHGKQLRTAQRASEAIQRLRVLGNQELIRTERLRGSSLGQQARCLELERQLASRCSEQSELQAQVDALREYISSRHQEALQERRVWAARRQTLDKALEDARSVAAAERDLLVARRREAQSRHQRSARSLHAELQKQEAALLAPLLALLPLPLRMQLRGSAAAAPLPPARASSAGATTRRSSGGASSSTQPAAGGGGRERRVSMPGYTGGDRVAALRASLHRQRQEQLREIGDTRAEVFRLRQLLDQDCSPTFKGRGAAVSREASRLAWLSWPMAVQEHRAAEERVSASRAHCEEQQRRLAALERRLDLRPVRLAERLGRIASGGFSGDSQPPLSGSEEALLEAAGASAWTEATHWESSVQLVAAALEEQLAALEGGSRHTRVQAEAKGRREQRKLLDSLKNAERLQDQAACFLAAEEAKLRGLQARCRVAAELAGSSSDEAPEGGLPAAAANRMHCLEVAQASLQEELNESFTRELAGLRAEAAQAEDGYFMLRQALLHEHAQAEAENARLLKEEAAQQREVLEELASLRSSPVCRRSRVAVADTLAAGATASAALFDRGRHRTAAPPPVARGFGSLRGGGCALAARAAQRTASESSSSASPRLRLLQAAAQRPAEPSFASRPRPAAATAVPLPASTAAPPPPAEPAAAPQPATPPRCRSLGGGSSGDGAALRPAYYSLGSGLSESPQTPLAQGTPSGGSSASVGTGLARLTPRSMLSSSSVPRILGFGGGAGSAAFGDVAVSIAPVRTSRRSLSSGTVH